MSYPWKDLKPKDTILLTKSAILSDLNVSTILSLYQPLMGSQAASLYLLIKEYLGDLDEKELTLSDILTQLDLGIREYYEARVKLEAYGLLKVYQHNETDEHLFVLEAPLHPVHFFDDTMLRMLLTEKLGERLVFELRDKFLKPIKSTSDYREITKSFQDVVHFNMENHSETINAEMTAEYINKTTFIDTVSKNSTFDWTFFKSGLNKHFISQKALTSEIKNLIETFHSIYAINELDMQKFVLEAADISSGEVSGKTLTRLIHDHYLGQSKQQRSEPAVEQNDQTRNTELKAKGFSREEIEIIRHAEKTQPFAYLKSIKQQKGGYVSSNESWLLKELVEQAPLSTSVINILINYILIVKNAPVLEKNLANKIANDWAQSNVTSPEEAIIKVKELYDSVREKNIQKKTRPKSNYRQSSSRKETLPSWANESEQTDEKISKEEEDAFRERLRQIRKQKSGDR